MSAFNVGKKVSAAIRILQRNRDASARATHLVVKKDPLITYEKALLGQATGGKFPSVTFLERKKMSTKTTIKRIALVAAAALTLGGFTAVSANATVSASTFLVGSLGTGAGTAAGTQVVGGVANVVLTETTTAAAGIVGTVTSSGVGSITALAAATHTGAQTGTTYPTSSVNLVNDGSADSNAAITISVSSSVAGTQTLSFVPLTAAGAPGTAQTVTITWGAAPVASAQYSSIVMLAGATGPTNSGTAPALVSLTGTNVANVNAIKTFGTAGVATIGVVANASATYTMAADKITATIAGPGTVGSSTSNTGITSTGRAISQTTTNGVAYFTIFADGNSGVSTITFADSTSGVTLGSRTVTFYGAPASVKVTQNLYIAKAGSTLGLAAQAADGSSTAVAQTFAYTAEVLDANGVDVPGATVKGVSSSSSVIASSTCVESTGTLGAGFWNCSVVGATSAASGATATVTFQVSSAANTTYDISATPITFAIGGAIATQALSFDAGSYTPLAPLRLITTAKDSKGNLAADVDATLLTSLVSSVALGGSGLVSPSKIVNGVGKTSVGAVYAPATAGDFVISAVDNASGTSAALSATGVSTGTSSDAQGSLALDAANAATDAANNAYDEAQNATQAASDALAAVTALSAQVSALIATVKSLAAMVAKIKAKVKA